MTSEFAQCDKIGQGETLQRESERDVGKWVTVPFESKFFMAVLGCRPTAHSAKLATSDEQENDLLFKIRVAKEVMSCTDL